MLGSFGTRLTQDAYDVQPDPGKIYRLLDQIAHGEVTLQKRGEEWRREIPQLSDEFVEERNEGLQGAIEADRKLAHRLLDAYAIPHANSLTRNESAR